MKNKRFESLRRAMKQHHRTAQWRSNDPRGYFVPHSYDPPYPELTYWSSANFILNNRRVWVEQEHPREIYLHEIAKQANIQHEQQHGQPANSFTELLERASPNYKKVGRSRKRVTSYTMEDYDEATLQYYNELIALQKTLENKGIDYAVRPSIRIGLTPDSHVLHLVAPLEIRTTEDIGTLVAIARRLIKRETTIHELWPDYVYTRETWLAERELRERDRVQQN